MLGWIRYEEAGAQHIERRRYGTADVLTVHIPRGRGVRGVLAAHRSALLLARQHVRLAIFPTDYSYVHTFVRRGITPPDVTRLNLVCAPQIVLLALRQHGTAAENANVALISERVCRELHDAAHSLARTVRYLTLRTPDAEALAHALRRECGIAAKVLRERDAIRADLALSFDAREEGCIALADESLKALYHAELGGEIYTDAPLLAALLSAGALRAQDIRLERLILPTSANFP